MCYTIQHRTVVIIFTFISQTIIIAQMCNERERELGKLDDSAYTLGYTVSPNTHKYIPKITEKPHFEIRCTRYRHHGTHEKKLSRDRQ